MPRGLSEFELIDSLRSRAGVSARLLEGMRIELERDRRRVDARAATGGFLGALRVRRAGTTD